ncbi:MAG: M48 family metallopeptidase [Thiotrichaceae bacterium]|nr:M48 family metallopeptidase [Thiotrichaceae bacterium]
MVAKSVPEIYSIDLGGGMRCDYTLRISTRAKRLRLSVTPIGKVEVIRPVFVLTRDAHAMVYEKREWLKKTLLEVDQTPDASLYPDPPSTLNLQMIDRVVKIKYSDHHSSESYLSGQLVSDTDLTIKGNTKDYPEQVYTLLIDYLKHLGKSYLPDVLEEVSQQCRLKYSKVTIRAQKTRWGSCTNKNNISLNCKLLFFPPEIARSVCIHELCHTLELNHSARFWAHVKQYDPKYKEHDELLKKRLEEFLPFGF